MVTIPLSGIRGQVPTQPDHTSRSRGHGREPAARPRHPSAGHPSRREQPWTFHLGYGALCLDFANTVSWRGSGRPSDRLPVYGELIRFGQQSKLLSEDDARRLRRESARRPDAAARALRKAVVLREALYRIFAGLAGGRSPAAADLEILNSSLPESLVRLRVAAGAEGLSWAWGGA